MEGKRRIALLIDADNASVSTLDHVLSEIADLGSANVRRAFGDWGSPHLRGWRDALLVNAIQPVQQVAYTLKGNASDMAMLIDAMDLLHSGRFDAFALMSSDSDFTPLAMRLRAANMEVYGFGRAQTPTAFKAACSVFFHVGAYEEGSPAAELPQASSAPTSPTSTAVTPANPVPIQRPVSAVTTPSATPTVALVKPPARKTGAQLRNDPNLVNLLRNAVQATRGEEGWSHLGAVGHHLANRGSFTSKNYGYSALKPLIVAIELFEMRKDGNHVKAKATKQAAAPAPKKAASKAGATKTTSMKVTVDPA